MKYAVLLTLGLLVVASSHCARAEPAMITMPPHWTLIGESLDVRTGEIVQEQTLQEFDTVEECSAAQAGRVERPHEGVLRVYVCRHDNAEKGA